VTRPNRRDVLRFAAAVASTAGYAPVFAEEVRSYHHEYPDMLLAFLAKRLNSLNSKWDVERAKLKTRDDIERRNQFVRDAFRRMVHGFPERTSLNAVVTKRFERDGYRIENVMFQSRPDFWVTGNLYIPTSTSGPVPGVISPCGHYSMARMEPEYQSAYINMVRSGFAVLAYDPIGQGERRQYWNPETNETDAGGATNEHSMLGQILLLMGEDLTHYRIWDGMRAIDYLLTRPEVDPKRIACAGHSGGGTLTLFISALDERVQCAIVNEGGTGHRWPLDIRPESTVGPSDVEQNLFPATIYGIDQCDLHVAIAPRPLLAMIENYSPRFNDAAEHIRARYVQMGAADRFATVEATDPHAWTVKLRLAATDWLCRCFYGKPGPDREPDFELEKPETLYCTRNGSIRYSQQGDTIYSVIAKKLANLPPERERINSAAELSVFRNHIGSQIRDLLGIEHKTSAVVVRPLVSTSRKGYSVEKLEFLSEPGIYVPAWVFVPEPRAVALPTTIYVHEGGKQVDGMEFGRLEKLVRNGCLVIAIDVRGVGDTKPPHNPNSNSRDDYRHLFDVETAMAYMAWYMDSSLFGMRVQDVLQAVNYALQRPDVAKDTLRVHGIGMAALCALYAGALDDRIRSTVCERGLLSYSTLARSDRYLHGANIFVRNVLKHFDLPHVAGAIADRELTLISPVDAMKKRVPAEEVRKAYEWTIAAYVAAGKSEKFRVSENA
jgi:cephalosporin-C deacetylase-like acetyl esterase